MMNVNPAMLIQQIKNGQNPQQLMMSVLQGPMSNTPMGANLLQMVQSGNTQGIEQVARNYMQQNGKDFEKEFKAFRQMTGL